MTNSIAQTYVFFCIHKCGCGTRQAAQEPRKTKSKRKTNRRKRRWARHGRQHDAVEVEVHRPNETCNADDASPHSSHACRQCLWDWRPLDGRPSRRRRRPKRRSASHVHVPMSMFVYRLPTQTPSLGPVSSVVGSDFLSREDGAFRFEEFPGPPKVGMSRLAAMRVLTHFSAQPHGSPLLPRRPRRCWWP